MNHQAAMTEYRTIHQNMTSSYVDVCNHCHATCLHTATTYCLEIDGQPVDSDHLRLLLNCAEICQTSVNLQLSGSSFDVAMCSLCAEVCDACAKSCRSIANMEICEAACLECAASCRRITSSS